MPVEYSYEITSLKSHHVGATSDVVVQVGFDYVGTEGENVIKIPCNLPLDLTKIDENHIPISKITQEDVIGWVKPLVEENQTYLDHLQEAIAERLDKLTKNVMNFSSHNNMDHSPFPWTPKEDETPTE